MRAAARVVYFDLDGVLVDSRPGIVACVARTLTELAGAAVATERIERIIGPPLQAGFAELLAEVGRADDVAPYVARYRELYATAATRGGTMLQPGIVAMLAALAPYATLAVATSKPLRFAEPMLQSLGIRPMFAAVAGPEPPLENETKTATLRRAMAALGREPSPAEAMAWMIGDRKHDIEAARACGVVGVGATWGFGSEAELRDAGADRLAHVPADVVAIVTGDAISSATSATSATSAI